MRVLGINAVFHDSSAALVVDGRIVAAAEEERFSRRKHGKACVPFSTWELPERAASWCLEYAGLRPAELDAVAYSYDPALAPSTEGADVTALEWEALRTLYVRNAPSFLETLLPGLDRGRVRFVAHHLAHAASAYHAAPYERCSIMVLDGRGERASFLAGRAERGDFTPLGSQALPHSLGLRYEELTMHLGFARSSDEYKVMALASYGRPRFLARLRELIAAGGLRFFTPPIDFREFCAPRAPGGEMLETHADLASSVQTRLQEVMHELARALHAQTADEALVMAGGVALNCVANSYLAKHGPFAKIWVQPAAGDAGTALGGALYLAHCGGDRIEPMRSAALGRSCAVYHRLLGGVRVRRVRRARRALPFAALFDRDGTLVVDDPELEDPAHLRLMPTAYQAVQRLRDAGIPIGIVTNQPRVGEGLLSEAKLANINARLEQLLGPIAVWAVCTHPRGDGCACRKPKPGLILSAARELSVDPSTCVVVGDIGSDLAAAAAAGARGMLVPTPATRREEIAQAPAVARNLLEAVDRILDGTV